jgi:hypothetical protein
MEAMQTEPDAGPLRTAESRPEFAQKRLAIAGPTTTVHAGEHPGLLRGGFSISASVSAAWEK